MVDIPKDIIIAPGEAGVVIDREVGHPQNQPVAADGNETRVQPYIAQSKAIEKVKAESRRLADLIDHVDTAKFDVLELQAQVSTLTERVAAAALDAALGTPPQGHAQHDWMTFGVGERLRCSRCERIHNEWLWFCRGCDIRLCIMCRLIVDAAAET